MTEDGSTRQVMTTALSLRILELLRTEGGMTLSEVTESVEKSKSTVHEHLITLHDHEFVVKDGDRYRLGLKFLDYGMRVRDDYEIVDVAQPHLEELAAQTGDMVWLTVEEHGQVVRIADAAGEHAHATGSWLGERQYMHYFAAGKVFLADHTDDEVQKIIERHGMNRQTPHTIQDSEELLAEIEEVKDTRVAYVDQEFMSGVRAVAAPVEYDDQVIAVIGISGPVTRFTESYWREELPELLETATNELELNLLTHRGDWISSASV